jgi:hypothetical protein
LETTPNAVLGSRAIARLDVRADTAGSDRWRGFYAPTDHYESVAFALDPAMAHELFCAAPEAR